MSAIVGRGREQLLLRKARDSNDSELVAVYGRRRVGKTFLVREYFRDHICFELTGVQKAPTKQQLWNFSQQLKAAFATSSQQRSFPVTLATTWQEAFGQLVGFLNELPKARQKRVVFFDELPWLASRRSGFLPALDHFWNAWAVKQQNLIVVLCGSAASWMIDKVLHARGGLYNRVTRRLRLEPFTLAEAEAFLQHRRANLSRYQILELYMTFGGIPHYLKEIEPGESAAQAIDRVCFDRDGLLHDEFRQLYAALFEKSDRHDRIVRALAKQPSGLTRSEMAQAAGISPGGAATKVLRELEESAFLLRVVPFGRTDRESLFRLSDEYSLFFLKWIERNRSRAPHVWQNKRGSPAWRAWSGMAFEGICLKHIAQLKAGLGIAAVETTESSWSSRNSHSTTRWDGAQIDLVIDRKDGSISLCEMKFSEGPFTIDKHYAKQLRNKRERFREETGTRKSAFLTMVTTYGVADNVHYKELVAASIEMDALFQP